PHRQVPQVRPPERVVTARPLLRPGHEQRLPIDANVRCLLEHAVDATPATAACGRLRVRLLHGLPPVLFGVVVIGAVGRRVAYLAKRVRLRRALLLLARRAPLLLLRVRVVPAALLGCTLLLCTPLPLLLVLL